MSQNHLVIDFPINGPANAKALPDELPALMPDLAKAQDDLGTVHFSRFMVEGDEKLLFLSDIDGEIDPHIEQLVESAGPVFDAIFEHVDDPPATSEPSEGREMAEASRPRTSGHVLRVRDASVQDIKACARDAGFTGNTSQGAAADVHGVQVTAPGLRGEAGRGRPGGRQGAQGSDSIGTLHVAHFVPFEHNHIGFFTVFDGDMEKYFQDFAEKTSFVFDALFPHVVDAPPTPVAKNAQAFYQWGVDNNYPAIGFYSAYPGLRFKTSELFWPIARRNPPPRDRGHH